MQDIDFYSLLRRVFSKQSINIELPEEIDIDNGYGLEGASKDAYVDFNEQGALSECIVFYMHFITEEDNLEYEYELQEFEAYRLCLEQHAFIRALLIEELQKKGLSEDYIESILSQWTKKPSDLHASIKYNKLGAMGIDRLMDCTCPQDIMLRCGCSCGASLVEKSYNKGFILDHSLSKKGVK